MNRLFSLILAILFLTACDDNNNDQPEPIILSENVEVYDENLISNDYIFIVENNSTNSYLINKEGFKVWEWNFDTNSGNDLEILNNV